MKTLRWARIALVAFIVLLVTALPGQLFGQVVDSITVEVVGEPAGLLVDGPLRAYVGDTLTYEFTPIDDNGDPTIAVVLWESLSPAVAEIIAETDSTLTVVLLARGSVTLRATVERLTSLAMGGTYGRGTGALEGTFQWASEGAFSVVVPDDPDQPRPEIYMCAVGYAESRAIFATGACADALLEFENVDLFYRLVRVEWSAIKNIRAAAE